MNPYHPFLNIGDKVKMTKEGLKQGLAGRHDRRTGVVVKNSRWPEISVRKDGENKSSRWNSAFWEKA